MLRAHSCHCISCAAATTRAVLRRPVASPTHWRLQYKHLTTLFYSTIITSAAVADVQAKAKRREQWEKAIAHAEKSLRTQGDNADNGDDGELDFLLEPSRLPNPTQKNYEGGFNAFDRGLDSEQLKTLSNEVLSSLESSRFSSPKILESRVSPHSIYASEFRQSRERGGTQTAWTPKKLVTVELSMAKLATQFLIKAKSSPVGDLGGVNMFNSDIEQLKNTLRELSLKLLDIKSKDAFDLGNTQRLEYPQYMQNRESSTQDTADLNEALMSLLQKHANKLMPLGDMMAKLAYNLLVSPAPPNVQTYSILINRLSRLRHFDMASMVWDSLTETHMRVNEVVLADALAHFARSKNSRRFQHVVELIKDERGGLMLARPDIKIGVGASRLTRVGEKVHQRIVPDRGMFNVMIAGSLTMDNLSQATTMYKWMRCCGHEADLQLLTAFLKYFTKEADWKRGIAVWHSIKHLHLPNRPLLDREETAERVAFHTALDLCQKFYSKQTAKAIYAEALDRGHTKQSLAEKPLAIRSFRGTADQLESIKRKIRIFEERGEIILGDVKHWAMQVLASRILLSGSPLSVIREAFLRHGDNEGWDVWSSSRHPALRRSWMPTLSNAAQETKSQPPLHDESLESINPDITTQRGTGPEDLEGPIGEPPNVHPAHNCYKGAPAAVNEAEGVSYDVEQRSRVETLQNARSGRQSSSTWAHQHHRDTQFEHAMM